MYGRPAARAIRHTIDLRQKEARDAVCTCTRGASSLASESATRHQPRSAARALVQALPGRWVATYVPAKRSKRPAATYPDTTARMPPVPPRSVPTMSTDWQGIVLAGVNTSLGESVVLQSIISGGPVHLSDHERRLAGAIAHQPARRLDPQVHRGRQLPARVLEQQPAAVLVEARRGHDQQRHRIRRLLNELRADHVRHIAGDMIDAEEAGAGRGKNVIAAASEDVEEGLAAFLHRGRAAAFAQPDAIAGEVPHERHHIVPQSGADYLVDVLLGRGLHEAQLGDAVAREEPIAALGVTVRPCDPLRLAIVTDHPCSESRAGERAGL